MLTGSTPGGGELPILSPNVVLGVEPCPQPRKKAVGLDSKTCFVISPRRMIQSAIPPLLLDFSSMMTPSVSLSVAPPQGREISSKTPDLFVDL
ncbi:hypothetical protein F2Q68_00009081 [Brassica cretica]|uniref:Uncharacterized protein n=1 Tax=Brassica cretica TaxID=69181 RepID=A0A8S9KW90_BRACR|nr:hypothetical protein F2Q68_00009081 [Brassica cretica]